MYHPSKSLPTFTRTVTHRDRLYADLQFSFKVSSKFTRLTRCAFEITYSKRARDPETDFLLTNLDEKFTDVQIPCKGQISSR